MSRTTANLIDSPKDARSQAGFSTVELCISMAVFVTVLLGSMRGNLSSRNLASDAMETQRAVRSIELARVLIEEAGAADLADVGGAVEPNVPLAVPSVLNAQTVVYTLPDWVAGTPLPSPLGVRLTVTWTSAQGHARSYSVVDAVR